MNEDADQETAEDKAKKALKVACERLPTEHPWGYLHYMDGPPAAGGGVGCFAWFSTRTNMLLFIAQYQVWLGPGPVGVDPARKVAQVGSIISHFITDRIDLETARLQINAVLKLFSQIEWWGQFKELVSGEGEFERGLRQWYRDFKEARMVDSSPVIGEEEEFAHAIQAYGL
jgi:hypothetical protein